MFLKCTNNSSARSIEAEFLPSFSKWFNSCLENSSFPFPSSVKFVLNSEYCCVNPVPSLDPRFFIWSRLWSNFHEQFRLKTVGRKLQIECHILGWKGICGCFVEFNIRRAPPPPPLPLWFLWPANLSPELGAPWLFVPIWHCLVPESGISRSCMMERISWPKTLIQ